MSNLFSSLFNYGSQPTQNYATVGGYSPATEVSPYTSALIPAGQPSIATPVMPAQAGTPSFMDSMLGYTDPTTGMKSQGWGGLALGAAQGLGNAWMGMKQYGLAEDAFKESKRQFGLNYEAQKKLTNSQLEDRQRARVASNSAEYQSVGEYMNKYGV